MITIYFPLNTRKLFITKWCNKRFPSVVKVIMLDERTAMIPVYIKL